MKNDKKYNDLIKLSTYASSFVTLIVIIIKIIGWHFTKSVSMLALIVDSFLDIFTSLMNLFAFRYSIIPPDHNHRFGRHKAQDLAVFIQGLIFLISGILVILVAGYRLIYPEIIDEYGYGAYIIMICIVMNLALVLFQNYVIKKTNSKFVEADKLHYSIDLIANCAALISMILSSKYHFKYIDPIFGIFIALYIIKGAYKLYINAFKNLLDHELTQEEKNKIIYILKEDSRVKGFHDIKTRYAANKPFIQFHVVLDAKLTLLDVHHIIHEIEEQLKQIFPLAEIIIHPDPEGVEEEIQYNELF